MLSESYHSHYSTYIRSLDRRFLRTSTSSHDAMFTHSARPVPDLRFKDSGSNSTSKSQFSGRLRQECITTLTYFRMDLRIFQCRNITTSRTGKRFRSLRCSGREASRRSETRDQFLVLWNEKFAKRQDEHARAYERGRLESTDESPLAIGDYEHFVNDTIKRKIAPKPTEPFKVAEVAGKNSW
jgi:hypothetical protein